MPGWTVTVRFFSSIEMILFIAVMSRTYPPFTGTEPPRPQVPAPLGTMGLLVAMAFLTIWATSSVYPGLMTWSGMVLKIMSISFGSGARSWLYSLLSSLSSDVSMVNTLSDCDGDPRLAPPNGGKQSSPIKIYVTDQPDGCPQVLLSSSGDWHHVETFLSLSRLDAFGREELYEFDIAHTRAVRGPHIAVRRDRLPDRRLLPRGLDDGGARLPDVRRHDEHHKLLPERQDS